MRNLFLAAVAALAIAGSASASVIPFVSGVTPSGGNFDWAYTAGLSGDERLDPAATNGVTCPGLGGSKVQCNPAGTFFTIYDFKGFVSASAPANWGLSTQLLGLTPSSVIGPTIDDPSIINVTFMYTGPVVNGAVNFTGFHIISTLSGTGQGSFSSQSTKNTGDAAGNTDQVTGPITVPAGGVPEPGTMLLLGVGLSGIALMARRRR